MKTGRAAGFSLLEAIVALVIVTTTLTALFTWINTDLISLRRAEAVVASAVVAEEVQRQLQAENLGDAASGSFSAGDYTVTWRAAPVESTVPGRRSRGAVGLYDHTLYDVAVVIEGDGGVLRDFSMRQHRFRKMRELQRE
jgi:general secretion pathway protein I